MPRRILHLLLAALLYWGLLLAWYHWLGREHIFLGVAVSAGLVTGIVWPRLKKV